MKLRYCKTVVAFLIIIGGFSISYGQTGQPYFLHDSLGTYYLAQIDLVSGAVSDIGPVPGVNFWVLGNKYCISAHDSTYTFVGHDGIDARLFTIKLSDASIVSNPLFNGVKVGLRYNCGDSSIYAIEEKIGGYEFVKVNKTTGATDSVGFFNGVGAYVGDAFALDGKGGNYHFMGLIASDIHIISINIYSGVKTVSPVFLDNPIGFAYSCKDSNIYAMWEDSVDYKLERIDPVSGTHSTVGIVPGLAPGFVAESASVSFSGEYSFRGFFGSSQVMATIDVSSAALLSTPHFSVTASGLDQLVCCMPSNPIITDFPEEQGGRLLPYPNPFAESIRFTSDREVINGTLRLYDSQGKCVEEACGMNGTEFQLAPTALPSGVYWVQMVDRVGSIFSTPFLKE